MKINVGSIDKIIRLVMGIALVAWGFYAKNWFGAIGIIPLVTALVGWCPMYAIFGIRTCPLKD
jgi:hypothetical protein